MPTSRATAARANNGRFTRTMKNAQRDAEACRMRSRGASYQQIADALGYHDRATAHRAVRQALAAIPAEAADELRRLQLDQLDYLTAQALGVLERRHLTISASGKVVQADGEPVVDDGPVLSAIDRLLKIQERRAKLMGLDAPARREVITLDALDAEIAELTAQLGEDAADEAEEAAEA